MGFRFQKRIRIFKGLTLNLSKSGSSWTVGRPGASVNLRGDKVTGNVGIPGTGLSYRESLDNQATPEEPGTKRSGARVLFWLALVAAVAYVLLR
jgi:hypothetical protein